MPAIALGVRRYCETDVLNTYLIYLRFELMRGQLTRELHAAELERVRALLRGSREPHHAEFLRAWEAPLVMAATAESANRNGRGRCAHAGRRRHRARAARWSSCPARCRARLIRFRRAARPSQSRCRSCCLKCCEKSLARVTPGVRAFWRVRRLRVAAPAAGGATGGEGAELRDSARAAWRAWRRGAGLRRWPVPHWGYRRRARLSASFVAKKGRVLVGFRERFKPYVSAISTCEILAPRAAALIEPLSATPDAVSTFASRCRRSRWRWPTMRSRSCCA